MVGIKEQRERWQPWFPDGGARLQCNSAPLPSAMICRYSYDNRHGSLGGGTSNPESTEAMGAGVDNIRDDG